MKPRWQGKGNLSMGEWGTQIKESLFVPKCRLPHSSAVQNRKNKSTLAHLLTVHLHFIKMRYAQISG